MAYQLLSEIHNHIRSWTVSVLVSCLWFYRGGTDNGPIQHMDLVVLDSQGNHMYVQISPQAAERLQHELEEGKVYMMTKFKCIESKPTFRAVESPYMIQFTRFSDDVHRPGLEADYPFCTYNLIQFQDIPRPGGPHVRFLDVIGRITDVSDVIPIHSSHQPEPSNTRTIILADLRGQELRLVLWGNRAVEFEAKAVRARDEKQAVIAIFVGTLPKMNQGVKGLSGSSACRWYIDEDLPVINDFRNRLGTNFTSIDVNATIDGGSLPARVYDAPVEITVSELLKLDPYENGEKRFICTVTVERLTPDQRWWFFSCSSYSKTSTMMGSQYRCTNPNCSAKEAQETIASPEVNQIIGQKYKLLVSISKRSFSTTSQQLSFQVVKIMEAYKPQLSSSAFDCIPGTSGASSSTSLIKSPATSTMFTPNTPSIHQVQPGSSSRSLAIGYQTPTGETWTPTSKLSVSLLPTASPGKSPCPAGSARRALFPSLDKKAAPLEEPVKNPDETTEVHQEESDGKVEPPSVAVKEKNDKDAQNQMPKNKRNPAVGKGAGAGKKSKQ